MGRLTTPKSPLTPATSAGLAPARRGSARERGYSSRWDKASAGFLRANRLCLGCKAVGFVRASAVTDHIQPHRGNRKLFWDRDNWQAAGRWHHDTVKQRLEQLFEQGLIDADALRLDSPEAIALTRQLLDAGHGPCT